MIHASNALEGFEILNVLIYFYVFHITLKFNIFDIYKNLSLVDCSSSQRLWFCCKSSSPTLSLCPSNTLENTFLDHLFPQTGAKFTLCFLTSDILFAAFLTVPAFLSQTLCCFQNPYHFSEKMSPISPHYQVSNTWDSYLPLP